MTKQILFALATFAITNLQMAAIADQTVISKKKSSTPSSDSFAEKHNYSNYRGKSSKEWKATEGSNLSKKSATQTSDITHSDGTFSSRRNHQSHTVSENGETQKVTKDHTAVSPDGSITEEHSSKTNTNSTTSVPASNNN